MKLFSKVLGEGQDVIILHGLYGSGDNWLTVARQLSVHYKIHLPDLRNHGNSPKDPDNSYIALVEDIVKYINDNRVSSPIVIGHSMGGKAAMWLSVLYPDIIYRLIVVDASPMDYARITTPSSLISQHLNIVNAMRIVDLNSARTRTEIDNELCVYVPSDKTRQFLIKSIERTKDGRYIWKLNVEAISNYLPEIMKGIDIEKYSKSINPEMPVLFIRGELSEYIPEEDLESIKLLYPLATIETIYGAGHWIHADKPDALIAVINNFLDSKK